MDDLVMFLPIGIVVSAHGWKAVPLSGLEYTERDKYLMAEIRQKGGIDETVPRGHYLFNVKPGVNGDILTLEPLK